MKQEKIQFSELDRGIKLSYFKKFLAGGAFTLAFFIMMLATSLKREFAMLMIFPLIYVGYTVFDLFDLLRKSDIFVFTGVCKDINTKQVDLKIKKYYGSNNIVLENDGTQCIVSVPQSYTASVNDTITVMCRQHDMFYNPPFLNVINPMVVRTEKYN